MIFIYFFQQIQDIIRKTVRAGAYNETFYFGIAEYVAVFLAKFTDGGICVGVILEIRKIFSRGPLFGEEPYLLIYG